MSTPQTTATAAVECQVPTNQDIVAFVHNLNGPVDIVGYTFTGHRIGVIVNPITDNEADVVVIPGQVDRLVATPAAVDQN